LPGSGSTCAPAERILEQKVKNTHRTYKIIGSVDFDLADPSDCNYLKVELNTRKKVPIGGLAERDLMISIVQIPAAAYA
jgi:hypothetical protein